MQRAEKIPWSAIQQIKIEPEKFKIQERAVPHSWLDVPVSLFPNLCVLEKLLLHVSKDKSFNLSH